jgi:aryl-alcohol dehydrogenase-like predicted oxidoreductase
MRQVELAPGVKSSVLGFGCAPVLGSIDARTATRAIHLALDLGVTHFDLARSYGYGEAESFVGRTLKSVRSSIRIATKFGIQANWKAMLLRPLKPMFRTLRSIRGAERKLQRGNHPDRSSVSDRFHHRVALDAENMRNSLESSLRALQTDYVDYFFIHEPTDSIERIDDLFDLASRLKEQGKIRTFGLAAPSICVGMHADYLKRFELLQFANSPGMPDYDVVRSKRSEKPNIFFSPFRLRGECSPFQALSQLAVDFPSSVILCSMFDPVHIRSNAEAVGCELKPATLES